MNEKLRILLGKLVIMMEDDIVNFDSYNIDYEEVYDLYNKLREEK